MAFDLGVLGLNDTERVFAQVVGQDVIYTEAQRYLATIQAEIDRLTSVFVARQTEGFKERYKLPGGGRMQEMGFAPKSKPAEVKTRGAWDVAYPIRSYQAAVGWDRVTIAYMLASDFALHIDTVATQLVDTSRFNILRAILNNTQGTFLDPLNGSLSTEPLANDDAVVYPPVSGSTTEATEDHYLESGYASASISNTNNPYKTIRDDLIHHFGGPTQGGEQIAVFINKAQLEVSQDLNNWVDADENFIITGTQISRLTGLPAALPGVVRGRTDGCWVIEWAWVPENYMVGVHLLEDPPLVRRVDPADTGLVPEMRLLYDDENFPFRAEAWESRYGLAAGNRLNGFVMELGTGGTYTIPTGYS